jgi:ribosomal protein S18 acetylase RimI-like enzyme
MVIRPATPDDVPAVLPMVRAVCAFHEQLDPAKYSFRGDPGAMYDDWLQRRAEDGDSVFLVADAGPIGGDDDESPRRKLVGFIVGTVSNEIPIYRIQRYGFLHDLWVEPRYRNEGIGRQLVTEAVARFRDIGVPQVRLDTAYANEPARSLFRACGFLPSTVEMLVETVDLKRET